MSYNLFEDPDILKAGKHLDPATKERYKRLGESLHSDIDFATFDDSGKPAFVSDTVARVEALLQSGMHISALNDSEKELMIESRGKQWYKSWGFTEKDFDGI